MLHYANKKALSREYLGKILKLDLCYTLCKLKESAKDEQTSLASIQYVISPY